MLKIQVGLATLTGLSFILLLQLYPWETLPVVMCNSAFLWLVILGELTPLMEEGLPCLFPFRNGSLNHLATKLLKMGLDCVNRGPGELGWRKEGAGQMRFSQQLGFPKKELEAWLPTGLKTG